MAKKDKTITAMLWALLALVLIGGAVTVALAGRDNGSVKPEDRSLVGRGESDHQSGNAKGDEKKAALPGRIAKFGTDKEEVKKDFTISGSVPALYPGATTQLPLTVTNPNNFAIKVTSLKIEASKASVAGCVVSSVSSSGFDGSLNVAKNATASTSVAITMADSAPDACQGAEFTLVYSGIGEKS